MEKRKNWLVLCLTAGFLLVFALWETVCQLTADHSFNNPFLAEIVHTFDQRFDC